MYRSPLGRMYSLSSMRSPPSKGRIVPVSWTIIWGFIAAIGPGPVLHLTSLVVDMKSMSRKKSFCCCFSLSWSITGADSSKFNIFTQKYFSLLRKPDCTVSVICIFLCLFCTSALPVFSACIFLVFFFCICDRPHPWYCCKKYRRGGLKK